MAKLTADQRRDLMEVIDDRHQRGSTLLATQIPLERWHDQIGDPTYGDAILDRLIHNAYRIELRGASMRQRQSSTEEKSRSNSDISNNIPDTHTIHSRSTTTTKKDQETQ
jgi:DNA replication protein DnaC